ncbi:Cof-type HAD-IIB family hydrolase [Crassaminicella profunda]|uniref:Cof-type HAD-IIB family hydrolase n=1 Tax=Crassaminicella profunda TaxID=1286698 RepID=UPI001CA77FDD|nr:Cof-type HAD-IIB family hydrolase [Crassaminicella profunda]QZY55219.1 Cof-type HAD-IIB family hydrolase [Crassaminicella profunda]
MMKYKAVISDLDGTLLNSDHRISDYTKKIIKNVVEKGIKFFIATGRHHMDASHIKEELSLDTTLISANGSRVHRAEEEIFACDLEGEIVKEILKMDFDDSVYKNIYQGNQWLAEKENLWLSEFKNESGFFYEVADFKSLKSYEAAKIFFICEEHEKLVQVKEKLEKNYGKKLNIAFSLPQCLEIMARGVSKGHALQKVLKEYNIHPEEVVAFGDGFNDLEMLTVAGKGLVMGNANDKLKEALPNHEIIKTNDEDAVANYLEKLFL